MDAAGVSRPAHHTAQGFRNPGEQGDERGFKDFLKWSLEQRGMARPKYEDVVGTLPVARPDWERIGDPGDRLVVTWLGHDTFLLQMGGFTILTDPIFSQRASPVSFAGPRRITALPLDPEQLPAVDIVVISHNHYDHLDKTTVRFLGNGPRWYVPLGLKSWFKQQGVTRVTELDWWETRSHGGLDITCTPARHFSARGLWDRNRVLWASWSLATAGQRVWFAGDTGYGNHFGQIGRRLGRIDLALIPIGAYSPAWFMEPMHVNPDQAVQAHLDLAARRTIGMHWGTFIMTYEPTLEPPARFRQAAERQGLSEREIMVMEHGETLVLK